MFTPILGQDVTEKKHGFSIIYLIMYWLIGAVVFKSFLEDVLEVLCERKVPIVFSAGDATIVVYPPSWPRCAWTKNVYF